MVTWIIDIWFKKESNIVHVPTLSLHLTEHLQFIIHQEK